jgi:hypothetical protein
MLSISRVHPVQPLHELVAGFLRSPRAFAPVVVGAAQLDGILLAGRLDLQAGVLAHRLVQAVARDVVGVLLHLQHQGLVHQRGQHVQCPGRRRVVGRADPFDVLEGEPAREHPQPPQQRLLAGRQQVVAPVDGGAQRLMPR